MRTLVLIIGTVSAFWGQSASSGLRFEVASVKPSDRKSNVMDFNVAPGGRLTVRNWNLRLLVASAYSVQPFQVPTGPDWWDSELYDIFAKPGATATREQVLLMLRDLLAERFHLKVHFEKRKGRIYALVVAKGGPRLKNAADLDRDFVSVRPPGYAGSRQAGFVKAMHGSMALLAERLSRWALERPVLDQTGIEGKFDFEFEYSSDEFEQGGGLSLAQALEKNLGLKLETRKGMVDTLVIDYAQRPTGE